MLKNLDRNWRKSLTNQLAWLSLDQNLKTRMLLQISFHPIGAKKNDASILPKAGCCYSVLTNFDFEWNKDKSATLFCPRFYQDCLYVIGNRHQIEIKVWCQFNESSIRVFAKSSQQISVGCSVDVCTVKNPKGRVSYKGNTKTLTLISCCTSSRYLLLQKCLSYYCWM